MINFLPDELIVNPSGDAMLLDFEIKIAFLENNLSDRIIGKVHPEILKKWSFKKFAALNSSAVNFSGMTMVLLLLPFTTTLISLIALKGEKTELANISK